MIPTSNFLTCISFLTEKKTTLTVSLHVVQNSDDLDIDQSFMSLSV